MNENKGILSTLNSVSSLILATLADGFTSYNESLSVANTTQSLSLYYLNFYLICCLLADSLNLSIIQ